MSHRKNAKNVINASHSKRWHSSKQKETISFIKLLSSFVSNKFIHKQIKLKELKTLKTLELALKMSLWMFINHTRLSLVMLKLNIFTLQLRNKQRNMPILTTLTIQTL